MLYQKRENFRINIRHQKHQQIFQEKRTLFQQSELDYTFEQMIDRMKKSQIYSLRNLAELNSHLLYFTQKQLTIEQILQIEIQAEGMMIIIDELLLQNNYTMTKEILILLANLTKISEKISDMLLINQDYRFNIIEILSNLLSKKVEIVVTLELLMNLWANSNSHKKYNQNLLEATNLLLDFCIQTNDNLKILLITKCYRNYLQNISEEDTFDYEFMINIVRKLLKYGIQENVDLLQNQLEIYCSIVQLYNYDMVVEDLNIILNLLDQCLKKSELIEIITRIISYFCINEPDNFYENLIVFVVQFSKQVIKSSFNEQIPYIINLCSVIFHQQCEKNYNLLQPFYDDQIIIMEIIRLQEDCQPRRIREASIRSIKILIENSNESQIQLLILSGIHQKLINVLSDFSLNSNSILQALISINNLLKIQQNKVFEYLELYNLKQLTKSKNKEIQKITYEIIQQVDENYKNYM